MPREDLPDRINEIAKRRGFYWPSFEIYGGLSGFYTYGDPGTKLKRNIENSWREHFVRRQGFLELEDPIINPEKVFQASGHLDHFKDYSVECSACGRSYRADHLVEDKTGLENVETMGPEAVRALLREKEIRCPVCGGTLKEPVMILTMFRTQIGATGGETGYARPEAAQGMFLNFRRAYLQAREKIPFAVAQTGKVLRNEISPRKGITRVREYTIMELELFFDPQSPSCPWLGDVAEEPIKLLTEEMEEKDEKTPLETTLGEALKEGHILTDWQAYFMGVSKRFVTDLGVPPDRQRFRAHLPAERSHYSAQTHDHEVLLEGYGWMEVAGHAYRTDYDLRAHQQGSGEDMTVLREDGTRFFPHVVEPSFGLDRLLLAALEASYVRKKNRNVLSLPRKLAPYQASVLPLVTKDGLPEKAKEVEGLLLEEGFTVSYDESGSIGRRYARADEVGTPLAITVDYDTMEKDVVTIRDRDTWGQVSQRIVELPGKLRGYFREELGFSDLGEPLQKA